MTIKEISDPPAWNDFVLTLKPNTFLHSWEWGQVQVATGEDVRYLGIYNNKKQVGAALVITVNAKRGRHYLIPHGPLCNHDTDFQDVLAALVDYLREQNKKDKVVALRVAPLIVNESQTVATFKTLGFMPAPIHVHAELTWVLNISGPPDNILKGMRKTTRHAVKKAAEKGVTVEIVSDKSALERFMPLYEQTKTRHGFVPFNRSFIEAQLNVFAPHDRFYIAVARYEEKDVVAAIFMHFGDTVFYYHGASTKLPSSIPAAQALQWAAIQEAKRRGAKRYNFWGIAPDDQPNHPFAGITVFKKGFGGEAIDYLHAQDLPLSFKYWKLWLVEKYRKYKRGF